MISNALVFDLTGKDWELSSSAHGAKKPAASWCKAVVPGNVHTDLMAAGLLADPHLGLNEADMGWVEKRDWWYRKSFVVTPDLLRCPRIILRAEGLDTYAALWINGRHLGKTQNSFVEHEWELKRFLKPGKNELLVCFASAALCAEALVKRHGEIPAVGEGTRVYARKAQYSFGWDWGPRLITSGIFKSIRLEGLRGFSRISDLHLRTMAVSSAKAIGSISVEIESQKAQSTGLDLSLGPWKHRSEIRLKKGLNQIRVPFTLLNPKLWWPHGHGLPYLYNLLAVLESGESASLAAGIKKIRLLREKDREGESFVFEVNGMKIFCKGANWIPADTFMGRLGENRVRRLVDLARQANMNMLRVWGGGFYESEEFYKACDEMGILVWQDFPFACNEVPELPWFVSEVKAEARKAIKRLRRHVSLAFWCGNNENQQARHDRWYRQRHVARWGLLFYDTILPRLCKELDPSTPYWPGSPYGGKDPNSAAQGDRHNWQVWAKFEDMRAYREDSARFMSEFGFASLPNRSLIKKFVPPSERFVQSRTMDLHDKVGGVGAYARIACYISGNLPESSDFDDFRYLSQVNQAEALVMGIEHWRRRQFLSSGALFWQLNDCWPVTSWAVLDSDDTPKLAWHAVGRAFDPLLLSALEDYGPLRYDRSRRIPTRAENEDGECQAWLSHEWASAVEGLLTVDLVSASGSKRRVHSGKIRLNPRSSSKVWSARRKALGVKDPASQFLLVNFRAPGLDRRAVIYFERPRRLKLENPGLTLKASPRGEVVFIRVKARKLTRYVELHASVPGQFSDNGFDLLPKEERELVFTPASPGARPKFSFKTLNEIALKRS